MSFIIGLICLVVSFVFAGASKADEPQCVLFLYHHKYIPPDVIHAYDWVVLDADSPYVDTLGKLFYLKRRTKLIGYMSVGEIERYRSYYNELKKFSIGKNETWNSEIADLREEEYINFLLNVVAKGIVEKGFDGFMLDTLDSYRLAVEEEDYPAFQNAQIRLIRSLKERYPDKLIVLNRGFEILNRVGDIVDAVVVESLFHGIDEDRKYVEVEPSVRERLLKDLEKVKNLGLPVVVIDYVHPRDRKLAVKTVDRIKNLGFIPYVSDAELSRVGHSPCSIVPRKIVLLYDSALFNKRHTAVIHRLVQMPLEYLGFVPELHDVRGELPEVYPELGYVGVVSLYVDSRSEKLDRWLLKAKDEGLKLFFMNDLPFKDTSSLYRAFGIRSSDNKDPLRKPLRVVWAEEGHGFEAPLVLPYTDELVEPEEGKALVVAENSVGQRHTPFAITPWGGYALSESLLRDSELWVYDPFVVFERLFKPEFPAPDVTTENGRRILTAHIDGDAFTEKAFFDPSRLTAEIIRDEVLKVFSIPHTVSIIEAELSPEGIYPERSEELERVALSIFSLDNVEPASHSYTHPFTWQPETVPKEELMYGYNLNLRGYKLDFRREIEGSIRYINKLIKGTGKRVKVFLWTGYCDPKEDEVRLTYELGVFNVNKGDTVITRAEPFLSRIYPMGIDYSPFFQVYAPVQNENLYTNLWTEPKWGYVRVIQTFELTEKPRRIKPISIYYHFYSAQELASLNALKKVYRYVLSQETTPIYLSEFAARVLDFRDTAFIRVEGGFRIKNSGYMRTVRLKKDMGYPDLRRSLGVLGFREHGDVLYVHLDGSGDNLLILTEKPAAEWANLVSTNAITRNYLRTANGFELELKAYIPIELEIDTGPCEVKVNGLPLVKGRAHFKGEFNAEVEAVCPD